MDASGWSMPWLKREADPANETVAGSRQLMLEADLVAEVTDLAMKNANAASQPQ